MSTHLKEIRIRVLDRHIKGGKRKDKTCCPIALALKDALADAGIPCFRPWVGNNFINWAASENSGLGTNFIHTSVSSDFVCQFDAGEEVEPFEFVAQRQ